MGEINPKIIKDYHKALLEDDKLIKYIEQRRGITLSTIKKYELGYDEKMKRFIIPVKDGLDNYANLRKWQDEKPKMISHAEGKGENKIGFGEGRLYPIDNVVYNDTKKIVICEGEWDCLMLNQNGIKAVTCTVGVNTWKEEWNASFNGFDVIIIFDCDSVSRKAAKKVKEQLLNRVKSLKILDLGLKNKGGDVSDFFIKEKKDVNDLKSIVRKTKFEDMFELIDLGKSMNAEYYNKHIKFNGLVIGKDLSPYLVAKKVLAECVHGRSKDSTYCVICPLKEAKSLTRTYKYDTHRDLLIKLIGSSDKQVTGFLRQDFGLPKSASCPKKYRVEILERQNVEDLQIIPELNYETINQEYVIRRCFYFGLDCKANTDYLMKGTTYSHPDTQMGIHLVENIEGSRDNISKFGMTSEIKKQLKIFQPKDPKDPIAIAEKLTEIYEDLTYNVTKMYKRQALIMAFDLVYHSVLSFKFLDKIEPKGWVELAIVGDTKCGKTETVRNLVKHYKAGEFLTSGENTTLAGILGGIQQFHKRYIVTWGKLPLNDRRAVIVDEADNLTEMGILGKLSGVRSSGIAEITKIQPQKTMARTRIIWIANPIHGKMNEKSYGVEVIREIFGKQQDISRLDLGIGVAREDISDEEINRRHDEDVPHKYTSEACHHAVMFAWSREAEHIKFAKGSEDLILKRATEFGDKYTPAIPLVIGGEMRNKLSRMAVALACRLYSTDDTGENVIVYPAHVDAVCIYLETLYDGKVLGYKDYSDQRKRELEIGDTGKLDLLIAKNLNLVYSLLDLNKFQIADLEDIFGMGRSERREIVKYMRENNIIRKLHTFYMKTPAFNTYLQYKRNSILKEQSETGKKPTSKDEVVGKINKLFSEEEFKG